MTIKYCLILTPRKLRKLSVYINPHIRVRLIQIIRVRIIQIRFEFIFSFKSFKFE
ncbi:hypothetical protein Hanom_Chr09g00807011 [Helianthus anomalus]